MRTLEQDTNEGYALDDPQAPLEGSDAGSSHELSEAYRLHVISSHRTLAEQNYIAAQAALLTDFDEAEKLARSALASAVSAFWWAEDSDEEELQHQLLHEIGRWKHQNVGCYLRYDEDKGYTQACLVVAAHRRMGLSIGFTAKRLCSLCDQDLSECPHLRGRTYWVRGGMDSDGRCRVCMGDASCSHRSDRLYRAPVVSVIKDGTIREVSLVRRPAQPEARILETSVSMHELAEHLGEEFYPGVDVSCDVCFGECPGFVEFDETTLSGGEPRS